jgi:hypothetical protein
MDAAAFEAALKWMRLSALHPLALVRGPRGDRQNPAPFGAR